MAARTVHDCDKCGLKAISPLKVSVTVDRYTDAAGSRDNDDRDFELCANCCRIELQLFLDGLPHEEAQYWVERVSGKPFRLINENLRNKQS